MDLSLMVKAQFDSVFLINGKMFEGGQIEYGEASVVYVTVLPLDASMLPYTVMLVGSTIKTNLSLASCYKLKENQYYLSLAPRFNYVYSPQPQANEQSTSLPEKFFRLLKNKKPAAARELMSKELSLSVDDFALIDFFVGFKDIIALEANVGRYYLINENNEASAYTFIIKDYLIDNIIEE